MNQTKHRGKFIRACATLVSIAIVGAAYTSVLREEKKHREEEIARELQSLAIGIGSLIVTNKPEEVKAAIYSAIKESDELLNISVYREYSEAKSIIAATSSEKQVEKNEEVKKVKSVIKNRDNIVGTIEAEIRAKVDHSQVKKELLLAIMAYTTVFILLLTIRNTIRKSKERIDQQNKESLESEKRLKDTATRSIRMAFEANSDGWWEWSRTQKRHFYQKNCVRH